MSGVLDLVGLLCLRPAYRGGLSCVANAVAIHNQMVRQWPGLAAALYEELPCDLRGQEASGAAGWFTAPAFTEYQSRLFVRFIPGFIFSSQRHPDAPRLSSTTAAAIAKILELANDPDFHVYMNLRPGEIQFVNNYHVLHGRTPTSTIRLLAIRGTSKGCGWPATPSPTAQRTSSNAASVSHSE